MASAPVIFQNLSPRRYNEDAFRVCAGSRTALHGLPLKSFSNVGGWKQRVPKSRRIQRIQTRAGLPVVSNIPIVGPIVNFVLSPVVLLGIYVVGAIQFLAGFSRTTYSDTFANRFGLATTWPILFLASKAFRENFRRAITR